MDWIESYLEFTADAASPKIFRLWAGITCLAAALERRAWVRTRQGAVFPNLLTLLVATPGIGKSEAIKPVEALWRATDRLYVSPKSLTSASLVDNLTNCERVIIGSPNYSFHSLQIPLTEFGTLITSYDMQMLNLINDIYDNPPSYSEKRRHFNDGEELSIGNPQISILAGTQPSFLSKIIPEEAWSMGFTSRLIMVYSGKSEQLGSLWGTNTSTAVSQGNLVAALRRFYDLQGQFSWTERAAGAMDTWYQTGLQPVPDHSKLLHYIPRRILHALKLCMVSGLSRSGALEIDVPDVERAMLWLIEAERAMPQIFREMTSRSDADVLNELHFAMWRLWLKESDPTKRKPVHESLLFDFLRERAPADKISGIIALGEKVKYFAREDGTNDYWRPLPKTSHGVE